MSSAPSSTAPSAADPSAALPGLDGAHLAVLLQALASQPGQGWALKDAQTLSYLGAGGHLPAFLARLEGRILRPGEVADIQLTDGLHAATLRASDQRALLSWGPTVDIHQFEVPPGHGPDLDEGVISYRVVRIPLPTGQILCLWADTSAEFRHQELHQRALRQIEEQQQTILLLRREISQAGAHAVAPANYSHESFLEQLRREIDLCRRESRQFALALVAVDVAEETQGHPERIESAMELVGRLMRGGTRAMDAVARIGPQRLALILSGAALAPAFARAETIRRHCATQVAVQQGQEVPFNVSVSVAAYPHSLETEEGQSIAAIEAQLLQRCEATLEEARARGGHCSLIVPVQFNRPTADLSA